MDFTVNLTTRTRKRRNAHGVVVKHLRYVLNYKDPKSGNRRQEFFERQKEAQARKSELILKVGSGNYVDERTVPTVAEAIGHWIADKEAKVKANTLAGYKVVVEHIRGPFVLGTPEQKAEYRATGKLAKGTKLLPMLGPTKLSDLTTAAIRAWHRQVAAIGGIHSQPCQVAPQVHPGAG